MEPIKKRSETNFEEYFWHIQGRQHLTSSSSKKPCWRWWLEQIGQSVTNKIESRQRMLLNNQKENFSILIVKLMGLTQGHRQLI